MLIHQMSTWSEHPMRMARRHWNNLELISMLYQNIEQNEKQMDQQWKDLG